VPFDHLPVVVAGARAVSPAARENWLVGGLATAQANLRLTEREVKRRIDRSRAPPEAHDPKDAEDAEGSGGEP
jgi:hypothetical protein